MEKEIERSIEEKIQRMKAYLDGMLSPEEEAEFLYWIDSSPKNKALLERVRDERVLLEKIRFRERNDLEKGWDSIQKKIRKRPVLFVRLMRYAAMLVVVVLGGMMIYEIWYGKDRERIELVRGESIPVKGGCKAFLELTNGERLVLDSVSKLETQVEGVVIRTGNEGTVVVNEQDRDSLIEKVEYNRMVVPRGGEYKIVLADGSEVWVNSQSELEFPSRFTGNERRVKLRGEAYFEITKNVDMPFIVEVQDKEIRVLGTSFNVSAYVSEQAVRTTLVSGKVRVGDRLTGKGEVILPGQQAEWKDGAFKTKEVDTSIYTAWIDGKFYFEGATLEEITVQLERWYDIDFFFTSEKVKRFAFAGVINKEYSANKIFSIIEKTTRVRFSVNGRVVTVSEVNNKQE